MESQIVNRKSKIRAVFNLIELLAAIASIICAGCSSGLETMASHSSNLP